METRIPSSAEAIRATEQLGLVLSDMVMASARHILTQWYSGESCAEAMRDIRTVADCVRALFPERVHPGLAAQADDETLHWGRTIANASIIQDFGDHPDTTVEDVRVVYEKAEQMVAEVVA